MQHNIVDEFNAYREKMNEKMLADNNKILKRIFNLDTCNPQAILNHNPQLKTRYKIPPNNEVKS